MKFIVSLGCFWAICATALAGARPNFVMVLIDDMGWGDFSCFGNKDAECGPHGGGGDSFLPVLCELAHLLTIALFTDDRAVSAALAGDVLLKQSERQ